MPQVTPAAVRCLRRLMTGAAQPSSAQPLLPLAVSRSDADGGGRGATPLSWPKSDDTAASRRQGTLQYLRKTCGSLATCGQPSSLGCGGGGGGCGGAIGGLLRQLRGAAAACWARCAAACRCSCSCCKRGDDKTEQRDDGDGDEEKEVQGRPGPARQMGPTATHQPRSPFVASTPSLTTPGVLHGGGATPNSVYVRHLPTLPATPPCATTPFAKRELRPLPPMPRCTLSAPSPAGRGGGGASTLSPPRPGADEAATKPLLALGSVGSDAPAPAPGSSSSRRTPRPLRSQNALVQLRMRRLRLNQELRLLSV